MDYSGLNIGESFIINAVRTIGGSGNFKVIVMKKLFLVGLLVITGSSSALYAQSAPTVTTPTVSGDKNLSDDSIKTRSIELERVERDAKKANVTNKESEKQNSGSAEDKLAVKYEEIKTDYENIQVSQDAIIKAYQTGNKIDYAGIADNASIINKSAIRLNGNLFPAVKDDQKDKKKTEQPKSEKSVRDLIVELDNTIGSFVTSPMFQNLRVIDPEVSEKANQQLKSIIELSATLNEQAKKSATAK